MMLRPTNSCGPFAVHFGTYCGPSAIPRPTNSSKHKPASTGGPNGELTLVPDTYPAVVPEYDGRPATAGEFAAFEAEYGPFLLADDEG